MRNANRMQHLTPLSTGPAGWRGMKSDWPRPAWQNTLASWSTEYCDGFARLRAPRLDGRVGIV